MRKLEVGMKVYLKPINNKARSGSQQVHEYEIKSVGRKYFEVCQENRDWTIKFNIENNTHVTNYTPDWKLYFSMQEVLDEEEFDRLSREIKKAFEGYGKVNLSLEQLREIGRIINNNDNKEDVS